MTRQVKQYECKCQVVDETVDYEGTTERFFVPCEIHDYDNSPPLHVVMDAVLYNEATKGD